MAKTLELIFNGEFGSVKLSVKNPKDSLTPVEIKTVMDQIILANSISGRNGRLVSVNMARLVDRTAQDIEFAGRYYCLPFIH
jgi:hypothetical protein